MLNSNLEDLLKRAITEGATYQSIFLHIPLSLTSELQNYWIDTKGFFWKTVYDILDNTGIFWCLANSSPNENGLDILPLELASKLQNIGFHTHNIILWYNNEYPFCSNNFSNRYSHILFLTKNESGYRLNIDAVREPHIWKNYEWGGGRKDRYHPLGKNPSNFWLKTKSIRGKTIDHMPLSWEEMVDRCLKSCVVRDDLVLGIVPMNRDFEKICRENGLRGQLISLPSENNALLNKTALTAVREVNPKRKIQVTAKVFYKSSESMSDVKDNEVQIIITSPPYWGLRDYGVTRQIGFKESYREYLERLETVWAECYRILNNEGVFWLNINKRVIRGKILLFPGDIIKSCIKIGFKLQDIVVWFRAISVPSGQNNFTDRYEYIMMFTKTDQFKFYRNKLKNHDFLNEKESELLNVWRLYRKIGNLSEDLKLPKKAIKHTAVFPDELVRRAVLLCSDEGDIVLDPFLGSGTTMAVAKSLRRSSIGYEINEAFKPLINAKLKDNGQPLSAFL